MPKTLVQNHQELIDWLKDGKQYGWIIATYKEKYGIELKPAMISNFRRRNDIPIRKVRNDDLIPWLVEEPHRTAYLLEMLRLEARVRAGDEMPERQVRRHTSFRENLAALDAVVMYDPRSEKGFHYVPREDYDDDIIRRPEHPTKTTRFAGN